MIFEKKKRFATAAKRIFAGEKRIVGNLTAFYKRVETLDTGVESVNSRVKTVGNDVNSFNRRVESLNAYVDSLDSYVNSLAARADSLSPPARGVNGGESSANFSLRRKIFRASWQIQSAGSADVLILRKKGAIKMAKIKRLSPNQLAEVKSNFAGLKQIQGYTPLKDEFKVSIIQPIATELDGLLTEEAQLDAQLDRLRDRIAERGTEFVQKMKGAAQQVVAQFGDDSPEYQSVGRKRISERATGRPSNTAAKTPNG